jgi:hypothetical protein
LISDLDRSTESTDFLYQSSVFPRSEPCILIPYSCSGKAEIDTSLLSNSGVYKISAKNKHGSVEEEVKITILSDTSAPEFNSSVYSLQLFHGQSGSVKLGLSGKPTPVITVQPDRDNVTVVGDEVFFKEVTPKSGEFCDFDDFVCWSLRDSTCMLILFRVFFYSSDVFHKSKRIIINQNSLQHQKRL